MVRVGFGLGYGPTLDLREAARWMRMAEERGFELGFFAETIELLRESSSALTAIALGTEKITIGGTQIVRLRTPLLMAQGLATVDEVCGGRLILAPGACTPSHARLNSLEPIDPALALTEWVEAIRLLLTGERVSYEGQVVRFENVKLGFQPVRKHIPLWIAATSRTGLRLAGRIGDGVLLNAVASPEYTVNALRIVREAVEAAGKDWSTFEVGQMVNCSVEDDHQQALDAIRWEIATKFNPVQLPFNAGPRMRVGEPHIRKEDLPVFEEAHRRGGMQALIRAIPDSYVENMTASGTPDEVKRRVQRYRDAGINLPVLRPASMHQARRLLDLFAH
jgi:alkanesulfonate monooxygenase SsuD/methylene tetrahydromethanopterin reductase-like flavin-dependent oxidoreductase (luciferase family)